MILTALPEVRAAADPDFTMVNCAACQRVSFPHDAWECDVKCNVAPTGVLTYGK